MVDIRSKENRSIIAPIVVIALALIAGFLFTGRESDLIHSTEDIPDSVIIIDAEGIANSTHIDQWAEDEGLELRRVQSSSRLTNAEEWVKILADYGRDRSPCVIVARGNKITIIPISDNLIDAIDDTATP